jgi:hypothetical protein
MMDESNIACRRPGANVSSIGHADNLPISLTCTRIYRPDPIGAVSAQV